MRYHENAKKYLVFARHGKELTQLNESLLSFTQSLDKSEKELQSLEGVEITGNNENLFNLEEQKQIETITPIYNGLKKETEKLVKEYLKQKKTSHSLKLIYRIIRAF